MMATLAGAVHCRPAADSYNATAVRAIANGLFIVTSRWRRYRIRGAVAGRSPDAGVLDPMPFGRNPPSTR
jgi:hypothetical protein